MEQHTDPRGRRSSAFPQVFVAGVAERIGIDAGYLSKILRGLATPSLRVAQKISREFDLTLDELIVKLEKQGKGRLGAKKLITAQRPGPSSQRKLKRTNSTASK